jgi:serine-threonine kinase receptor-associated protein
MSDRPNTVPLTCHGHSRPITKIEFSTVLEDGEYFVISGAKGKQDRTVSETSADSRLDMHPMLRDGITGDW